MPNTPMAKDPDLVWARAMKDALSDFIAARLARETAARLDKWAEAAPMFDYLRDAEAEILRGVHAYSKELVKRAGIADEFRP